ncbi:UDP-N-acetylmuramoyl-tripeptide--D-alanyl-D-alanine ligase [Chondromyces apiculatus]|uniref:UDP-N-acetylmuramoyl-tripeptide--D-alanyl-D-alanine ligase n=1 Tax=Chondromyces apiculatus DSM 436 TaxID=1192034 RepID=A0A017SWR8_9BACT|nr:UDP-N-acetylmuramoyl-tripeptide--D-alanyl-D-alanine ligase [Chondromyces apiculatus]EYF00771.1 UDP-N-acetylmuramoylalanyl-D-glutamyl-2,6-diaminopimelate--D-alanyl-D-alanine ligase [Chondromyces apiculatus DSM 436]
MATPIPQNVARFSLDDLARLGSGRVLQRGPDVQGISTDSRALAPGAAFVALVGERFDGHAFLDQAVRHGAGAVVVSREVPLPAGVGAVLVTDTLAALGAFAGEHRARWGATPHPAGDRALIGVAGSAGKTTTTRTVAALLRVVAAEAGGGEVHATAGNLNNGIGVPMTLLGLSDEHRFAVVEIGTNNRGEVATLAAIARPEVGVVTTIGVEHTEGLGSLEEVAQEEGDLFAALPVGGVAVGNADDPQVMAQLVRSGARRQVGYGTSEGAVYRIIGRRPVGLQGSVVDVVRDGKEVALRSPLLGEAGALAAVAALAVVEELLGQRLSEEGAEKALTAMEPPTDGRLSALELGDGTVVIDDSYNANPVSMRASLRAAAELSGALGRRLLLVLGEMRELGGLSGEEHDALGVEAAALRPVAVIAVAGDAARTAAAAAAAGASAIFVGSAEEAAGEVRTRVRPGDLVLVKGSRGVRMERIVEELRERR